MAKQTFTTGQVLTAAQMTSLQQTAMGGGSATAKTASYTLVAADAGTTVIMNSGSATTITVNTSLFAAGDTVFIVNQGAGVCTITAGTATVSTAGSLAMGANETGQLYFLSTSAAIFSEYTQSAGSGGKLAQVVSTTKTDTFTMSSSTFADVTGLSVTITPTSATSTILVMANLSGQGTNAACTIMGRLVRNSTAIAVGTSVSNRTAASIGAFIAAGTSEMNFGSVMHLDSPATTSATTYKIQVLSNVNGQTVAVNRSIGDTDSAGFARTVSSITVMEILA